MIAPTAIIHPHVRLGQRVTVEDYCIIGAAGADGAPRETIIGDDAHIRSHTVIYAGNKIGKNFATGNKANIRENNEIGDNVSVGTLTVIEHSVRIGDGTRIHSQAFIPEFTTIESNSWIGPNVVLTNAKYPDTQGATESLRGPTILGGARIGANATLLPGVRIGRDSIVGAGSVVTKSVDNCAVVAGNPAKMIRKIDDARS